MNGVSEKQIAYAMSIRADAANQIESYRSRYMESKSFKGRNLFAIYNAGRELILSYTEAKDVIDNAYNVVKEVLTFANLYERHCIYCEQHGQKKHAAAYCLKHAAPGTANCRYLTPEMIELKLNDA